MSDTKTIAEIIKKAKQEKEVIEKDMYVSKVSGEEFDLNNLTTMQKIKLRNAANNPNDPYYDVWLRLNREKQVKTLVDKDEIKKISKK